MLAHQALTGIERGWGRRERRGKKGLGGEERIKSRGREEGRRDKRMKRGVWVGGEGRMGRGRGD